MKTDEHENVAIQAFRKFQASKISEWTFLCIIKGSISLSYESGKTDAYRELASVCQDKANREY